MRNGQKIWTNTSPEKLHEQQLSAWKNTQHPKSLVIKEVQVKTVMI